MGLLCRLFHPERVMLSRGSMNGAPLPWHKACRIISRLAKLVEGKHKEIEDEVEVWPLSWASHCARTLECTSRRGSRRYSFGPAERRARNTPGIAVGPGPSIRVSPVSACRNSTYAAIVETVSLPGEKRGRPHCANNRMPHIRWVKGDSASDVGVPAGREFRARCHPDEERFQLPICLPYTHLDQELDSNVLWIGLPYDHWLRWSSFYKENLVQSELLVAVHVPLRIDTGPTSNNH